MDIIYLRDLRRRQNRSLGMGTAGLQTLVIDLDFALDIGVASSTDDLKDTVDYKAISDRIMKFVSSSEFNLLEALGENLCQILMEEFELPLLWLKINKLGVLLGVKDVGIIIERGVRLEL